MARHCRRVTRPADDIKGLINRLLEVMWDLTDTMGHRLINKKSMNKVWGIQQKHLPCFMDPVGVDLYTKTATLVKGGKVLDGVEEDRHP
ncbi:Hypp6781 [Branchiostoma lanceolatum]|uniref:Hypp6781 protein n=1 Tax=Branchiostoma lanceolatum TaxID=7740 RepID=A0A8K0E7I2_BRALA|nr:Hypp6781 [Branchiostoma lanceolatum]